MSMGSYSVAVYRIYKRYELTSIQGVKNLMQDIHKLRASRFTGTDTTYISDMLMDFELVLGATKFTDKQYRAFYLYMEKELFENEIGEQMGITQQMVNKHIDTAIRKIVITAKERKHYV
jgi:DNA-binding CsgD family transcriptional regulator